MVSRTRRERPVLTMRRGSEPLAMVFRNGRHRATATAETEKQWLKACRGKKPHVTERAAEKAARETELETGRRMHTYRCQFCGEWHLATTHADPGLGSEIALLEAHLGLR